MDYRLNFDNFWCILASMKELAAEQGLQTDTFREDFELAARRVRQVLWVVLALIVHCIFVGVTDQGVIYFLGGLLVVFGGSSELLRMRALRNVPVITVGPEGVSFPQKGIEAISWDRVIQVRTREFYVRGTTIKGLDFRFRKGTLSRWQFGRLGVDRWEVVTGINTLIGKSAQLSGDADALIASVERFHSVKR